MKRISMIFCFIVFLSTLLLIKDAPAQTKNNDARLKEILSDLKNYAQKGIKEWRILGMAIGIVMRVNEFF